MSRITFLFALAVLAACAPDAPTPGEATRPNIVFIVADDLGYSDLGLFGSEIPTPNIDALANEGMVLTQFYANMLCSPTRAMYLSGTDNHLAGLGVMRPPTHPAQREQPGYESYLNERVVSLADLLKDAGYHTYVTGKWHLGAEVETGPIARGFEQAFISIDGASHLGRLGWIGPGLGRYRDGEELVHVGESFYSTAFYTERMIDYIERDRGDDKPFFAYLAYTAPHWPLQAPAESIAKFESWYDDGYEALYLQRLARMKSLGLVAEDFDGIPPIEGQPAWEDLSAEEQRTEARKMEIYAAMVNDLDSYVGQFIDYLKSVGEYDNTFIMFISDNGPEGRRLDLTPPFSDWIESCCDNSFDNLGQGDSYVMYGPNWARAGTVPFRDMKWKAFEGGIRVPAIVHLNGIIPAGTRSAAPGTVVDIYPTFLELAGTEHPGERYRGKPVLPVTGKSMVPLVTGETTTIHGAENYFGWEMYGQRGIRQGNWKLVMDPSEGEDAGWHLYNLTDDPGEQHDLAAEDPERLQQMLSLWDEYLEENGVILAN